jgi:hypothetical protein
MLEPNGLPLPGVEWLTWDLVAVGALFAGTVLALGLVLLGRRSHARPSAELVVKPGSQLPPGYDPFLFGSTHEKRSSPRREGNPIAVHVTSADGRAQPVTALVLNRSIGGLRLFLDNEVAVGKFLSVRPSDAPRTTPWVQVEVRYCREVAHHFEVGCQFLRTPSWGVLVLFG